MTRTSAGLAGALVALCAAGIEAQRGGQAAAPTPFVAIGCVSREQPATATPGGKAPGPRFIITDMRGDKPTIYRLEGDQSMLDFHVGHTVEVSGPIAPGTGPNANALVLTIKSLVYISMTCDKK